MILYSHTSGNLNGFDYDSYGLKWSPLFLATAWYFYRRENGAYDKSEIDLDVCRQRAQSLGPGGKYETTGPLVLDIEEFGFAHGDWEFAQEQLKAAIEIYREEVPHLRIGFYGIMPKRDYWSPVLHLTRPDSIPYKKQYKAWKSHNTLFRSERRDSLSVRSHEGLADLVDFVSPSLYTFYSDVPGNLVYIQENIKEARRYNKPIIAWMWTQYHDSSSSKYQYLGDDYINQQLDLLESMKIEGVVFLNFKVEQLPESFFKLLSQRTSQMQG